MVYSFRQEGSLRTIIEILTQATRLSLATDRGCEAKDFCTMSRPTMPKSAKRRIITPSDHGCRNSFFLFVVHSRHREKDTTRYKRWEASSNTSDTSILNRILCLTEIKPHYDFTFTPNIQSMDKHLLTRHLVHLTTKEGTCQNSTTTSQCTVVQQETFPLGRGVLAK